MAVGYIVAISVLAIIVIVLGAVLAYVQLQRDNDEDPQDPKVVIPDVKGMLKEAIGKHAPAVVPTEASTIARPEWMNSQSMMDAKGLSGAKPKLYGKHFSAGAGGGNEPGLYLAGLKEDDPKNFSAEDQLMARFFAAHGGA